VESEEWGMWKKNLLIAALIITVALAWIDTAFAHKVNIFAYAENGTVYTESYFPDGKAVQAGTIEVYDSQGQKLLEGKTDQEGKFSFPVPKKDDLKIVIIASMGHRNEYVLKKDEL